MVRLGRGGTGKRNVQLKNILEGRLRGVCPIENIRTLTTTLSKNNMALEVREELRKKVEDIKSRDPTLKPALVIVQVGGREDSNVYIRMKLRAAEEIGISASCLKLEK